MGLDIREFFRATNPGKTLFVDNPEQDQKYYIDFSSVRGGQIIEDLKDNIVLWSPDEPTCQLFTGHIGCGKSTELLRLKAELEKEGFHVVYFESSQDLDMGDVDVGDILLAIARLDPTIKPWGRSQPEYLFVDRGAQLRRLHCHLVYTMPLALRFSNEYGILTQRFMSEPKILPMVPVQLRDGGSHAEGMALLRQMVLARAFPELSSEQRLDKITEIFDSPETLDRLCCTSGGHVRNLLRLLNDSIKKERKLPLSRQSLESVIRARRHELVLPITPDEWQLLRQVKDSKQVAGDEGYQTLIRSMFVYEYRDKEGSWFDINPILAEAPEFQP